jgi:hypothetical protein
VVCIKLILVRFSATWHLCQKVTIPITQMWWNVMPSTNEKSHVINFWIFVKIFKQFFLNGNFVLYEKHHSHFVLLAYALIFIIILVGLSFIFRRHGNLLSDVKLAYNLENKHTVIGWYFKNLFIFHNGKLKVKSYKPLHVC